MDSAGLAHQKAGRVPTRPYHKRQSDIFVGAAREPPLYAHD